jgi:CBS domain-containing protein
MPTAESLIEKKGHDVATVDRTDSVLIAAQEMNRRRIGAVVVRDGGRVVGIFTERDILNRVVAAGMLPGETLVGTVMTSPMAVCRRDTKLTECKSIMTQKRIRHLPIVEEGTLYGLISIGDIMASEVADQQATIEYLHEYLHGHR